MNSTARWLQAAAVLFCFFSSGAALAAPSIELVPGSIDFSPPEIMVGLGSPEKRVIIRNVGADPRSLSSITIKGAHARDFRMSSGGCPPVLQPKEQCEKFVEFRPSAAGARGANLLVRSDDPQHPEVFAPLGGAAITQAPRLATSVGELDFGAQPVGVVTPTRYLTATNVGTQLLQFTSVDISPAGEFSFVSPSDCGAVDLAAITSGLNPTTCYAYLVFTPGGAGPRAATLRLASNDPNGPALVTLRGIGTAPTPRMVVAPTSINFGSALLGDAMLGKIRRSLSVMNQGTAALTVTASVAGTNPLDFRISSGAPCTAAPSQVCSIALEFEPRSFGPRSGQITLASNDPLSPSVVVGLSGFGEVFYPPAAAAQNNHILLEPDTVRAGGNYSTFAADEVECRRRCRNDARCWAFTVNKQAQLCSLKDQATVPTTDAQFVSGIKGVSADLGIVTINMAGHSTLPDSSLPDDADWSVRADRLATAIADLGPDHRPDIISLTEVEGWRWCSPGTGATVGDYDMIDRINARLKALTSITYRVAYMVGNRGTFGWFEQCRYFSGDAILYNPARLANRNLDDAQTFTAHSRYDDALQGFQLRHSVPMCRPGSARMPLARTLIDGDPQLVDCKESTPSGPAWTWIHSAPEMTSPITAVRFSFRHDSRSSFDFFTAHPMAGREAGSLASAINPFIDGVTVAPYRTTAPFYSPILAGDVNSLKGAVDSIPNFTEMFGPTLDVMTVRRGLRQRFSGVHDYRIVDRRVLPADPAAFFSDHYGLYVRLAWLDPHDAHATQRTDFDDGTTVGEPNGGIWAIFGGARFPIPDPDTHHRFFNGRLSIDLSSADFAKIGLAPVNGTLLREESGAIWVVAGGAKFHVPDPPTLSRLFPDDPVHHLWNGAVSGIPNVPADGTLLAEENGTRWVIAGGAKFQVPNLSVYDRLYPGQRPFRLWNGAVAAVPDIPLNNTLLREESSLEVFVIQNGHRSLVIPSPTRGVQVVWDGALTRFPLN